VGWIFMAVDRDKYQTFFKKKDDEVYCSIKWGILD
jgi:hypothetical protein